MRMLHSGANAKFRNTLRSGSVLGHLMPRDLIIAIDGPSGAGKGTVARALAAALGYQHVDSGAMYRAVGWKAQRDGVPLDNEGAVASLAARSPIGRAN